MRYRPNNDMPATMALTEAFVTAKQCYLREDGSYEQRGNVQVIMGLLCIKYEGLEY
jgi:hypothetical protein